MHAQGNDLIAAFSFLSMLFIKVVFPLPRSASLAQMEGEGRMSCLCCCSCLQ